MQCQNPNCRAEQPWRIREKCDSCSNCPLCGKIAYEDCEHCDDTNRDACQHCCQCEHCEHCELPYITEEDFDRIGRPTDCKILLLDSKCECCDRCEHCCNCVTCDNCSTHYPSGSDDICSLCDRCNDCCSCSSCDNCGRRMRESHCDTCDCCSNCCGCFDCDGCGRTANSQCGECSSCEECCSCNCDDEDGLEWVKPQANIWHGKRGRYLGVEIEVDAGEREQVCETIRKWGAGVVRDGSLSNNGFEITTAPARGDAFLHQIKEVCSALNQSGAVITRSCGLHVHVDARDLKFYEIRRVAKYYAAIEPALYAILPEWRRSSHYCLPSGHHFRHLTVERHKELRKNIHRACYQNVFFGDRESGRELSHRKKQKYDDARYHGLNLHSWFYRGTVEFRHFGGSTNFNKITCWARLCCAIIEFAAQSKDFEIDQLDPRKSAENLEKAMNLAGEDVRQWVEGRWEENMPNIREIKTMSEVRQPGAGDR